MGKDRPMLETKLSTSTRHFHDDVGAQDIRWHQVGCKLDPAEGEIQDLTQSANEKRLPEARHAFQQDVATGEEGGQGIFYRLQRV